MSESLKILVSIAPVFTFLIVLIFLDSYKLINSFSIIKTIFIGCLAAFFSLFINIFLLNLFTINVIIFARYIAPLFEELLKAIYPAILIRTKKVGFMVDAAIYGFAVGTGFALIENVYYLHSLNNQNIFLWIIRGFGTAIMHGGTTTVFAIVSKYLIELKLENKLSCLLPGLISAYIIHSSFNHFFLPPVITTVLQLIVLSFIITFIFAQSEKELRKWLEIGMETDIKLLEYISSDEIKTNKVGQYLYSLKSKFPAEIVADMFCYLQIYSELSIRAKGVLLMRETGFKTLLDPDIKSKFLELEYLEKSIGKTGKLAISPLLHSSSRDLWQLYIINK